MYAISESNRLYGCNQSGMKFRMDRHELKQHWNFDSGYGAAKIGYKFRLINLPVIFISNKEGSKIDRKPISDECKGVVF